jgi:hypothetical protein
MWKISDNWVCNKKFSSKTLVDKNTFYGEQLDKLKKTFPNDNYDVVNGPGNFYLINDHDPWTFFIDFKNSKKIHQNGEYDLLVDKYFYEGKNWPDQHILVFKSKDSDFYMIAEVEHSSYYNEYWYRYSDGPRTGGSNGVASIIMFKCNVVE